MRPDSSYNRSVMPRAISLLLLAPWICLHAQQWSSDEDKDGQRERAKWFYGQREYPGTVDPRRGARHGSHPPFGCGSNDAAHRQRQAAGLGPRIASGLGSALDSANWTLIGPKPTGGGSSVQTAGRVNAVAIDPRDNNTVYIGAAEGGVWKTTDGGANWTSLTDSEVSLANGSIAIDPQNPDTVYVGTGEENFAQDAYYGAGILKSTDGGQTWTNYPGPFAALRYFDWLDRDCARKQQHARLRNERRHLPVARCGNYLDARAGRCGHHGGIRPE